MNWAAKMPAPIKKKKRDRIRTEQGFDAFFPIVRSIFPREQFPGTDQSRSKGPR